MFVSTWMCALQAVAEVRGPAAGLAEVDALASEGALERFHLLHAARADLLRRLGRNDDARIAYERALQLTHREADRLFLERRSRELSI